jgi:catechol 2,3-dioxygenase-like lactoylglutathione lyase family enzyme
MEEVQGMIFDHVAQIVPNIAEAVRWYRDHFEHAEVLYQDDSWAFLDCGGTRLAFVLKDEHPGHIAWRVSASELERLATKYGKAIKPHRDRTKSFYLEAPGGQHIEIITFPPDADARVAPRTA